MIIEVTWALGSKLPKCGVKSLNLVSELRNACLTGLEWDLHFELAKDKMLSLLSKTCTKQVKYTSEESLSSRSSLSSKIAADVIFVHGLRGGPFMTWRQQEKKAAKKDGTDCWPKVFACKTV